MFHTYLLFPISTPLSLSVCVTVAVTCVPVVTFVLLIIIPAWLGAMLSSILTLESDPAFVPSHSLAYTVSPWFKSPTVIGLFAPSDQLPSVVLFFLVLHLVICCCT